MNLINLRTAEAEFMQRYPGGFDNDEIQEIGKKHRVDKMVEQANELLAKKRFTNQGEVLNSIVKLVTRSSMVSLFEKPKFRAYVNGMNRDDREFLAGAYQKLLHGNAKRGFTDVVDVLSEGKLAKWSLMTICPFYLRPQDDVFVKPTTTKNVIRVLDLEDLIYRPRPTWEFYETYRDTINELKGKVDPSLSPNNAAFTGFLMIALGA